MVQEKKRKLVFQNNSHGGHLGFPIGRILAILDPDASYQVKWPVSSEEEAKIDSKEGGHFGYPIGTILAFFYCTSHPDVSSKNSSQYWPFAAGDAAKNIFSIGTILTIFGLQVILMLPAK